MDKLCGFIRHCLYRPTVSMYLIKKFITKLNTTVIILQTEMLVWNCAHIQVGHVSTCWNSLVIHLLKLHVTLCLSK